MITGKVAHVADDGRIHGIQEHLRGTAELAALFAGDFGCAGWARLAGLWHDLGKYSDEFQCYIRESGRKTDHSTAGAIHAVRQLGPFGRVVAYLIAGHHAGLPDWLSDSKLGASLAQQLTKIELLKRLETLAIPDNLLSQEHPTDLPKLPATELAASLWIRMLFSCLVDADFLDTSRALALSHISPAPIRKGGRGLKLLMSVTT